MIEILGYVGYLIINIVLEISDNVENIVWIDMFL